MRQRYDATQVIWECKNYENLKADDFHQVAYYSTKAMGRLVMVAFRGKIQPSDSLTSNALFLKLMAWLYRLEFRISKHLYGKTEMANSLRA